MKRTPLRRATPLKRSQKRLRIRVRERDVEWARAVKVRDHYLCRWCYPTGSVVRRNADIFGRWDPENEDLAPSRRGCHAAHVFGRSKRSVRWDVDNGVTLCFAHHVKAHGHAVEWLELVKRELGEAKFESLRARAMGLDKTQITMTEEDNRGAHVS